MSENFIATADDDTLPQSALPSDAVSILTVMERWGHSRDFFVTHCCVYRTQGKVFVSAQEAEAAHKAYMQVKIDRPKYQPR